MNRWRTTTIEDLASSHKSALATGPFGSAVASKNFRLSGVPMLRGSNLSDDVGTKLDERDLVFLDPDLAATFGRSTARKGDLVFTCWGSVGQVGLIGENAKYAEYIVSNKQMKLSPDAEQVDSLFLYYNMSQPKMIFEVQSQAIGSTIPGFNLGQLRALKVEVPELAEQRAIAAVLGALDDKIATNTKLAATGESLLTAEFHRRVRHLPFSEQTFGDVAKVSGGGTPSTSNPDFWNGDVLWATPTDVTGLAGPYLSATSRRISKAGLTACASELYPAGTILMTSRATIGAFALAQQPMAVNQGFIVVQPYDAALRFWLFHEMRSRIDEFISLANGATFLELSRGNFKKFKVRVAEPKVMKDFVDLAGPIHAVAADALSENSKLSMIRDTLLPQLMSGKLRVKDAEKVLEDASV